jgi:hypothetical protein
VAKDFHRPILLSEPTDTACLAEKQGEVQAELYLTTPTIPTDPVSPFQGTGTPGSETALTAALITNLNAVSRAQLESLTKEDRKKSMLSRLSPETEGLFTLLAAHDWNDASPKLNVFAEKLLSDKDPTKALNVVHSATRNWKGRVCECGILQFFSTGYMANNIHARPSGFTIFMCHPDKALSSRSTKNAQQSIRSMLGENKIDEASIKYFASQDFFLANNITEFEGQLETCILFLELMTQKKGIASEGYGFLKSVLHDEYQTFTNLFRNDPHFGVRLGYLADRVFQRFINKLVVYDDNPEPLLAAGQ